MVSSISLITPLTGLFKMDLFKPNLIYTVKLHLFEEGNAKLAASICNPMNPNAS